MEGAGATGEDTVRKRTGIRQGEVVYLLSRGGTHKIKELKGGTRITKQFFTLKIFKIIEKFGF